MQLLLTSISQADTVVSTSVHMSPLAKQVDHLRPAARALFSPSAVVTVTSRSPAGWADVLAQGR